MCAALEGYWSAIRLHAVRVLIAAPIRPSISPEQLALLREHGARFVTLLLDGDDAGGRPCERLPPDLASSFFVSAPLLADGEKPDKLDEDELRQLTSLPYCVLHRPPGGGRL